MRRALVAAALAVLGLAAAWLAGLAGWVETPWTPPAGEAAIGGPFTLLDGSGRTVTDRDFRGKVRLVYFGYTWCPDVCPTDLQRMAATLDLLGAEGSRVAGIFITIDPERDTPARAAEFAALFHPAITGLSGPPEAVAGAVAAYRVHRQRMDTGGGPDGYLMEHSAFTYLMDRRGRFVRVFGHQNTPEQIAAAVRDLLAGRHPLED